LSESKVSAKSKEVLESEGILVQSKGSGTSREKEREVGEGMGDEGKTSEENEGTGSGKKGRQEPENDADDGAYEERGNVGDMHGN
jgi:hypothetical protein